MRGRWRSGWSDRRCRGWCCTLSRCTTSVSPGMAPSTIERPGQRISPRRARLAVEILAPAVQGAGLDAVAGRRCASPADRQRRIEIVELSGGRNHAPWRKPAAPPGRLPVKVTGIPSNVPLPDKLALPDMFQGKAAAGFVVPVRQARFKLSLLPTAPVKVIVAVIMGDITGGLLVQGQPSIGQGQVEILVARTSRTENSQAPEKSVAASAAARRQQAARPRPAKQVCS